MMFSQGKESTIASLPVGADALGRTVAAPEKMAGVGFWPIWDTSQCLDEMRGKRNIDRRPGLCLVEQQAIAVEPPGRSSIGDAERFVCLYRRWAGPLELAAIRLGLFPAPRLRALPNQLSAMRTR